MKLFSSLLLQLENPHLSHSQRAELSCEIARQLEDAGEYESAREALSEFWQDISDKPKVGGLSQNLAAELLLRAGTLTGWIGHARQLQDAQEQAKNLITESIRLFDSLKYTKKILEAQTELAYCYWREGAYDEARDILKGVIDQLTTDSELKAKAVLRIAIVEGTANRYHDALRILTDYAPLFEKINNHTVKGGYYTALGLFLKNLAASEHRADYLDRAFIEYAAASYHFEQAGHVIYLANVENNLGFLYYKAGKFAEAHEHLERARRLLVSRKDNGTLAQVDETRARVFLAQRQNLKAEHAARAAVTILEKGGRQSLLAEALTTQATALARLGHHEQSSLTFYRSIEVAHQSGALNDAGLAALTLLEELGEHLDAEETQSAYQHAYEWLISSQHEETLRRLLYVSMKIMSFGKEQELEVKGTLRDILHSYEAKLIKQALQRAGGVVTQAARLLGISHQSLVCILKNRHRELLKERTPAVKRRRSIAKWD
ncbi:MAG TPA: helix-turn-helix domain-containing protein [Pyrinomonadaceae bacterium]|jgi:tetratricopeptide (TPR) repeat protein